jgi:hypothetical protein
LKAVIQVVDAKPGTSVSVAHLQASRVDDAASERPDGRAV